ncbi:MAG TPA: argininosuccinate lyase [Nitrososphaeraceae archaeon]|nr:argininosuccinate lyase [Nitrososphaeraceae archaeon]
MYRSRQKENLDKDVLNFLSSLREDVNIFYYDILGTQAHCLMLNKIGILTSDELSKVLYSLNKIKHQSKNEGTIQYIISNELSFEEDIHEQIESIVIGDIGIDIGGKIHTGRSRNDQVVLDLRMKLRDDIMDISEDLISVIKSLIVRAKEHKDTIISLYTHLQQAQIGTMSHYLLSYSFNLLIDLDRISSSFDKINLSPLGSCAIGGTGIPIDRNYTASLLGFHGLVENSIDATSSRDSMIEYLSFLTILMTSLSRIAEDLILWSTSEFSYIELSDKYSSTSSVMPQKKNPDPLEILRSRTSIVIGMLISSLSIIKNLPSGYNRDLQDLKPLLWNSSKIVKESLRIMKGIIDTFKVNKKNTLYSANKSYGVSLDIAEQIVIKYNIPFRKVHKLVGQLVQYAITHENIPLDKTPQEEVNKILNSSTIKIDLDELMSIIKDVKPEKSITLRKSYGSPNPLQQNDMINSIEKSLLIYNKVLTERKEFLLKTINNLDNVILNTIGDKSN